MSFAQVAPQGFGPIRVKAGELSNFFSLLKQRRVVRGDDAASFRVTNKPFEGQVPEKKKPSLPTLSANTSGGGGSDVSRGSDTTKKNTPAKRRKRSVSSSTKPKAQQKAPATSQGGKKRRTKLEVKLSKATL